MTLPKSVRPFCLAAALTAAFPLAAGFPGTDVVIPAAARASGVPPSQFYSTLWITNLGGAPANVTLRFLRRDESNVAPTTAIATLQAAETRKFENAVESLFALAGAAGAIRITSDQEVLASSRTYNLPSGSTLRDASGLFFSGIPVALALALGDSAQLQGVSQGGGEDFRYNFGLVEVGGAAATVTVRVRDASGATLGTKDYELRPYEARQFGILDAAPGLAADNARLEATVTAGTGRVIPYGTGVANGSQDSIGFEMSFKASALVPSGVLSLNGLTGAIVLTAGSNVAITPTPGQITIASTAPSGSFTLPYAGATTTASPSFSAANTGTGSALSATANDRALAASATGTAAGSVAAEGTISSGTPGANASGVRGTVTATGGAGIGVWGAHAGAGWGVYGSTVGNGIGVFGISGASGIGVEGRRGEASGITDTTAGGVWGDSRAGVGVLGSSRDSIGVEGASQTRAGVQGVTSGTNDQGVGVAGIANPSAFQSLAGLFQGNVRVTGNVTKGGGAFRIDHPLDPENKVLQHSFVESPDMKNVYDGLVLLDAAGSAVVTLPDWFEALNGDYRYQLTCVGGWAPVYVAEEIASGRFRVAGGKPGLKVSWQVTGIRRDAYARRNPIVVEEEKPDRERGHYLHPDAFSEPEERGVDWARDPEGSRQRREQRERLRAAERDPGR